MCLLGRIDKVEKFIYYFGLFYLVGVIFNSAVLLFAISKSLIYSIKYEEHHFTIPDKSEHKTIVIQIILGWNYWILEGMDVLWF
jgi:glucan biosynthesis protein